MRVPAIAFALLAAGAVAMGAAFPAGAQAPTDTLGVDGRDDHSPALAVSPAGSPVLAWIATTPDTSSAAPGDALVAAAHDASGWGAPEILLENADLFPPDVALSPDGARWITCTMLEGGDSQIFVRRDLGGVSSTFQLGDPALPDLAPALCAMRSDSVLVVWQAWRDGNYEILASVGNASGFSSPMLVSECQRNDHEPDVVWGNDRAWIVWSSYRGEPYNLLCRTFDGAIMSDTRAITNSYRARNLHPRLAFDEAHDLLWITHTWVNQGWNGFNQREFPGLFDRGSPRVRVFDGTVVYEPQGLNADHQFPLAPMETLGYERFLMDGGTRPMFDRWGSGVAVAVEPDGSAWCFHRQLGTITELGAAQRYWGVVGARYDGASWSTASAFLDLRASLGFEHPALVAASDSLWVAWSADHRASPIQTSLLNLFGTDSDIVVRRFATSDSSGAPPALVSLGAAGAPGACPPESHPQPQITIGESTRTLYWGDTHRHSVDFSWDGDFDPLLQETIMYSLDFLGHDFLVPSDHAERYSPLLWTMARKMAQVSGVPGRFVVFPGYERSMQGFAGGTSERRVPGCGRLRAVQRGVSRRGRLARNVRRAVGIETLSIPHTTAQCGVVSDWFHLANGNPDSLPAPLRVVEVYQALRESFEYPGCPLQFGGCVADSTNGWVNVALALGMRVGLLTSSDHDTRAAFAGVWAVDPSREAIFDAMRERSTFGTSRATKITVDFRVAGGLMGTEVEWDREPDDPRLDRCERSADRNRDPQGRRPRMVRHLLCGPGHVLRDHRYRSGDSGNVELLLLASARRVSCGLDEPRMGGLDRRILPSASMRRAVLVWISPSPPRRIPHEEMWCSPSAESMRAAAGSASWTSAGASFAGSIWAAGPCVAT